MWIIHSSVSANPPLSEPRQWMCVCAVLSQDQRHLNMRCFQHTHGLDAAYSLIVLLVFISQTEGASWFHLTSALCQHLCMFQCKGPGAVAVATEQHHLISCDRALSPCDQTQPIRVSETLRLQIISLTAAAWLFNLSSFVSVCDSLNLQHVWCEILTAKPWDWGGSTGSDDNV